MSGGGGQESRSGGGQGLSSGGGGGAVDRAIEASYRSPRIVFEWYPAPVPPGFGQTVEDLHGRAVFTIGREIITLHLSSFSTAQQVKRLLDRAFDEGRDSAFEQVLALVGRVRRV